MPTGINQDALHYMLGGVTANPRNGPKPTLDLPLPPMPSPSPYPQPSVTANPLVPDYQPPTYPGPSQPDYPPPTYLGPIRQPDLNQDALHRSLGGPPPRKRRPGAVT